MFNPESFSPFSFNPNSFPTDPDASLFGSVSIMVPPEPEVPVEVTARTFTTKTKDRVFSTDE